MTRIILITDLVDNVDLVERIGDRLQHAFGDKHVMLVTGATTLSAQHLAQRPVVLWPISAALTDQAPSSDLAYPSHPLLETALSRQIPIIPLLLNGALMPRAENVPDAWRAVTNYNAVVVRGSRDFPNDMELLIRAIKYAESAHDVETLTLAPSTLTQAFALHMRLPQSRRALGILIGFLAIAIALSAGNAAMQDYPFRDSQTGASLADVLQIAFFVALTVGIGVGVPLLLPPRQSPFGWQVRLVIGLLLLAILLPASAVVIDTTISRYGVIEFGGGFTLSDPSIWPKIVAIVSGAALIVFVGIIHDQWLTTLLAGVAAIFIPLVGVIYLFFGTFIIFSIFSITAQVGLVLTTILLLGRAIMWRRWHWVAAITLLPLSLGGAIILSAAAAPPIAHAGANILGTLTLLLWPIALSLAPWLVRGTQPAGPPRAGGA